MGRKQTRLDIRYETQNNQTLEGVAREERGVHVTSHAGIVVLDLARSAPLSSLRSLVSEGRETLENDQCFESLGELVDYVFKVRNGKAACYKIDTF